MFGSVFYNFWAAIVGFSLYFYLNYHPASSPLLLLISSFIAALVSFALMFAIRAIIGYVTYVPEPITFSEEQQEIIENESHQATGKEKNLSPEELAQAVKTVMN